MMTAERPVTLRDDNCSSAAKVSFAAGQMPETARIYQSATKDLGRPSVHLSIHFHLGRIPESSR